VSDLEFQKALVFCPHPDDAEFSLGGTMARWTSEGKEVVLCVVTDGSAGSNDPGVERDWLIRTRAEEQRKASALLGVEEVIFLGYEDGYVEDSHELRRDIVREIRRHRPDVVVGPDPTTFYFAQRYVNHPDHRKVGEAFLAAVNPGATTVPLYREDLYDQGFEPHQVTYCLLSMTSDPDHFVDITDFIERKIEGVLAHDSQMRNMDAAETVGDRIKEFGATVAERFELDFKHAEAFKLFRLGRSLQRDDEEEQ
jgi:LmbE family N-acetylglucosaminyl deacetylase